MSHSIAPLDLSFLLNETRDAPQHVGGLLVFEAPAKGWKVADLVRKYRAATPVAPFDRIPRFPLLGLPNWETVHEHDMLYHVQHVAVPAPGTDEQLDELVQQWHSELLDRSRPMYQLVVIEGLSGGRFAIYGKIHHAIVDGAAAIRRLLGSLSPDPAAPMQPPLFAVDPGRDRRPHAPRAAAKRLAASFDAIRQHVRAAGELSGEFLRHVTTRAKGKPVEGSLPFSAPVTAINVPVTYGRAFAHLSLPMAPLRAAAKRVDGTLNDAVLAVVDAAVSRYLEERGDAPRRPLHPLVPVSLRDPGSTEAGSMVSGVICPLGDPGTDVHARLARIVERMNAAKANIRGFSKAAATDYFVGLFFLAQGIGAAGVSRPVANMVVSNVPGTPDEVYLAGARLAGVHPLNVLTLRMGLSVTLVSCGGRLDIGLIANRSALPDPGRIADYCRDAFAALERPVAPTRARRPGRKETAAAAATPAARKPRAAAATKRTHGAAARARKP